MTITPRIILLLSVLDFHGKRPRKGLQELVGPLLEVEWEELELVDICSEACGPPKNIAEFMSNHL